jgi:hypothetical protein
MHRLNLLRNFSYFSTSARSMTQQAASFSHSDNFRLNLENNFLPDLKNNISADVMKLHKKTLSPKLREII